VVCVCVEVKLRSCTEVTGLETLGVEAEGNVKTVPIHQGSLGPDCRRRLLLTAFVARDGRGSSLMNCIIDL